MKKIILCIALLMLAGCASLEDTEGVRTLTDAGITHVELKGCNEDEGQPGQLYCSVIITDGKEKEDVAVEVVRNPETGEVRATYSAGGVQAFEGQAGAQSALVAIQEWMTKQNIEITPEITGAFETLTNALWNPL